MRTDGVDHGGLLTNEQTPRAMKHQATLLLYRLGLDKPHVGSGHSLADCLGVSRIILLSFDIRSDVGRRHQADPMPERLQLPRPMMRCRAGLHTDKARWHLLKERQHIAPLQLAANDHMAISINAMHLKNRLRDIQTDCLDCLHDWLL